jgi:predicted XRE-type DNA-binding protein
MVARPSNHQNLQRRGRPFLATSSHLWRHSASSPDSLSARFAVHAGFPAAAEREAKLRLAYALNQVLDARKLSQADAARVLGVTQPKVSAVRHYNLAGFSVERLMNLLAALDQDVEIVIRRKLRSRKVVRVSVVAI